MTQAIKIEIELSGRRRPGSVRRIDRRHLVVLLEQTLPVSSIADRQPVTVHASLDEEAILLQGRVTDTVLEHRSEGVTELELELESDTAGQRAIVERLLIAVTGTIVLGGFVEPDLGQLVLQLEKESAVLCAATADQVLELLVREQVTILCLGKQISGREAADLLRQAVKHQPDAGRCHVILAAGDEPEHFQEMVAEDQIYYLSQQPPPAADTFRIITSAAEHLRQRGSRMAMTLLEGVATSRAEEVFEISRRLAREASIERFIELTSRAIEQVTESDRAFCLVFDPSSDTLWTPSEKGGDKRRESAASGLVSFVIRTGAQVCLDHVGSDPRYDAEADTNGGSPDQRFLAVPVETEKTRLAVLVALRDPEQPLFGDRELKTLQLLAGQIAALFTRISFEQETANQHGAEGSATAHVFRREALQYHARGAQEHGHLLRLSPDWIRRTYPFLLIGFLSALLFSLLASIHEYAPGLAVVRVEGRTEITARLAGSVTAVEVAPGRYVECGQLLVRFYNMQELAELERITRNFELGLINRLRSPNDRDSEQVMSTVRAQKELAEKRLEERSIRAPHSGVVGDIRVREGQHVLPGQSILSLIGGSEQPTVISLFPGRYRPLIEPGMALRLELHGYKYAYQQLVVDAVGEVVGPTEARRMLGTGIGDALPVNGSVVFVTSRLPSRTFVSNGRTYEHYDGMQGTAEIRVRSERIITTLLPGLKALFDESDF